MASYDLVKSDQVTVLATISDGLVDNTNASLTFVGKNVFNYGQIQNTNFLHLLENFASGVIPRAPLAGQLWYDTGINSLKVYDATRWNQLPKVIYSTTATNQASGDLWFNTTSAQLFVKAGSTYTLIGPKTSANTAGSLETSVNINGVPFNGTQSITVSSTTTNSLSTGSFIVGGTFNGSAATTWSVNTGQDGSPTPSTVVARNAAGNIWYNVGFGIASSARYADLAEKYLADTEYEVGTVVMVGGEKEVTAAKTGSRALGVVSGKPAYLMNDGLEGGTAIALKGRVPVKVFGPVNKGDRLEAVNDGLATVSDNNSTNVFAIALESSTNLKIKLIEAVIL
jgi:hypothetical protein